MPNETIAEHKVHAQLAGKLASLVTAILLRNTSKSNNSEYVRIVSKATGMVTDKLWEVHASELEDRVQDAVQNATKNVNGMLTVYEQDINTAVNNLVNDIWEIYHPPKK